MKKVFVIPLILAILCLFAGCVIIPVEKNFVYDAENVASIEVYIEGDNISIQNEEIDEAEPFYILEESQHEGFLSDLAEIQYTDHIIIVLAAIDPSFCYGNWTVKIIFNDGSYRLLSCDGYGEDFDAEGNRTDSDHYGCDNDEWIGLIKKYLPETQTSK